MNRHALLTALAAVPCLLLLPLLAGCGGGGSGSGGSTSSPESPVNVTRLLQPGDKWVYERKTQNSSGGFYTQNDIETIEGRSDAGVVAHRTYTTNDQTEVTTLRQLLQPGATSPVFLQSQSSHQLIHYPTYDSAQDFNVIGYPQAFPFLFGQWQNGAVLRYEDPKDNDNAPTPSTIRRYGSVTYRVVGTETVTTPAGRFATWKVEHTVRYATQGGDTRVGTQETLWYAPEIGNVVRRKGSTYESDGSSSYETTLIETTVRR